MLCLAIRLGILKDRLAARRPTNGAAGSLRAEEEEDADDDGDADGDAGE